MSLSAYNRYWVNTGRYFYTGVYGDLHLFKTREPCRGACNKDHGMMRAYSAMLSWGEAARGLGFRV